MRSDLDIRDSEAPPPNPDNDEHVGKILGDRYRVVELLRLGGMSRIYLARHLGIKRRVAIKILSPTLASDESAVRRFLNEARAAGTIGHPNIVESLDVGRTPEGLPFLVLELLEGTTIAEEVLRAGDFAGGRAAYIGAQIASGLAAAHAAGVIHRDLKPENVQLVTRAHRADHVKILDFGISKFVANAGETTNQTRSGIILGTPAFMAPEQVTAGSVDERTDVYALGGTLYTMLAGVGPFEGEPFPQVLQKILHKDPPSLAERRPDLPRELVAVVEKAMAKSPAKRFARMAEVEAALLPFATETRPPNATPGALTLGTPLRLELKPGGGVALTSGAEPAPNLETIAAPAMRKPRPVARLVGLALVAAVVIIGASALRQAPSAPSASAAAGAPTSEAPTTKGRPDVIELDVRSDAPGARAVVRGASHPLPYKETVRSGGDLELVEITAPTRQGRRYWLRFDEGRHLFVHLPAGEGTLDATPEELAVALGESPSPVEAPPR